jgi:Fe-coproporphyrin III synthase
MSSIKDSQGAYSSQKIWWHLDKISAVRRGQQIIPAQVQLILSDLCQQGCHFCGYRRPDGFSSEQFGVYIDGHLHMNPNRMIPTAKVREILEDCSALGVRAVQLTGGGEPTLHPQFIELVGLAQQLGIETALVSNGALLRPGWEQVYPQMAWIRISVDAGTPETYAQVRAVHPTFFHKVLQHITEIRTAIDRVGSPCLLGGGYVITPENWSELYEGVGLMKQAGVHNVRLSAMFSKEFDRPYGILIPQIEEQIAKTQALTDTHFHVVDMFGDRLQDLSNGRPTYEFCGMQQFVLYIGGNQRLYRCCTTAYTHHGEVGDLTHQRLIDWFHSEQKSRAYADFKASSCHVCQFNQKNRAIVYAIDPAPVHVNFV